MHEYSYNRRRPASSDKHPTLRQSSNWDFSTVRRTQATESGISHRGNQPLHDSSADPRNSPRNVSCVSCNFCSALYSKLCTINRAPNDYTRQCSLNIPYSYAQLLETAKVYCFFLGSLAHGYDSGYFVLCFCQEDAYRMCGRSCQLKKQTILPKTFFCLFIILQQNYFLGPPGLSMAQETSRKFIFTTISYRIY